MPDLATARPAMTLEVVAVSDNLYEALGGQETFVRLVDRFYAGIATDPVLAPMYSAADRAGEYAGPRHRMTTFLAQYFGGPRTYSEQRGHPRLRIRHAGLAIDAAARDRWLHHALTAVRSLDLAAEHEATLTSYLNRAAQTLVNR